MQVPPATEVLPAPQSVQSVTASLPAGDDLPALQDEHVVAPEAAYLPASHVTQVPPSSEVLPSAQSVQSVTASLPAGDDLPALQESFTPSPVQ